MSRAVARALAIFDAFDAAHTAMTLQEIAQRLQMPKTTAFRLVNTLEKAGFLVRLETQEYCLSWKLVRLSGLVKSNLGIRETARPVMIELSRRSGETITLNALSGIERVCIEVIDTPSPLMSIVKPGEHVPLLFGATGRLLMAYMSSEELEEVLRRSPQGSTIDRVALQRELERFRAQGYALTSGQRVPGVTAISVPIRDMKETVRYCLSLTGPSVRVDGSVPEFVQLMVNAGADISRRLGSVAIPAPQDDGPDDEDEDAPPRKRAAPVRPRLRKVS
ncbi:MAG TPA: IclR family transcriptional regulator [Azospirillum sp.]|nr:IclR family transcriptional regulator [Azospirillum sp.]